MSGIKDPHLAAFLLALKARPEPSNITKLVAAARIGRCHFEQMLSGERTGRQSWKHVMPHLEEAEVFHLKQCSAWNNYAEAAWNDEQAVRGLVAMAG